VAHRPKNNLTNVGSTVNVEKFNNQKMKNGSDYGHPKLMADVGHHGQDALNGHRPHTSHPTSNISSYRPIPSKNLP